MHRGYIKIWRKIEDSGLYQMPNTLALFLYLLSKAMHKDCRVGTPCGPVDLRRGQYISGRLKLAADLQQSEQSIRTGLSRLAKLEIINQQSTSKYSTYTIVNYEQYQDCNQQNADNQPAINQQSTSNQPATNQQLTTKEDIKAFKAFKALKEKHNATAAFILPDWIDSEKWALWMKTRKGKKLIPEQMHAQIAKLTNWRDDGLDYATALENAAANGWQGLFLPDTPFSASSAAQTLNNTAAQLFRGQHAEKAQRENETPRIEQGRTIEHN